MQQPCHGACTGLWVPVTARGHFPPEVDSWCDFFVWFEEGIWGTVSNVII
jgi:hypothetical protein